MKIIRIASTLAITGMLVASLAACSAPAPSPSPSASSTPSATKPAAMTPAEAKAAFAVIAKESCFEAQKLGVVESSEDFIVVALNKDEAYKDYSAAYLEYPSTYGLIWELDAITACADYYTFSMAEEAGQEADIDVTFDENDATFTTFEDFGEYGTSNYKFTIVDGKFSTAENLDTENERFITIRYGSITADDRAVVETAVEEYLAKD
ncbi:MAG: hypothetical protein ACOVP3_00885 [Rhodoluna sp.]|jgi:hypothetical protein